MAPVSGSKVVVTGGCGFIGSHLVRELLARRVGSITVLDDMRYGSPSNLPEASRRVAVVAHHLGAPDLGPLSAALEDADYLFHLAAEKHNQALDRPDDVLTSNVKGSFDLSDLAGQEGVKKAVYASSLYAYGRSTPPRYSEQEIPSPTTVYGISKLAGEHFFARAHRCYGLSYTALRYLFVYGPRQFSGTGYKSVIVRNFERILANEPPVIFGDGEQVLDYVYVDDVVDATIRAAESGSGADTFNVASSTGVSINELVETMLEVAGSSLAKVFAPPDATQGSYRVGDNKKIEQCLGFRPSTTLREGLKETFDWMRKESRR